MAISGAALQAPNTEGWVDPNSKTKKPRKNIDFSLHSLWGLGAPPVIQPEVFTASGALQRFTFFHLQFGPDLHPPQHWFCLSFINVGYHLGLWSNRAVHEL